MKVIDDGVIKYDRSNFSQCGALLADEYEALEYWRKKLYQMNLIGEYPEVHIGFGNMSTLRDYSCYHSNTHPQFVITGTQTGKYADLNGLQYTRVLDYQIDQLKIQMMGAIEASSEALTHAAIYAANPNITAVFHIHSNEIWKKMIEDKSDFTCESIPYGTVEMAHATQACIKNKDSGVFCMHGHEDGIVIYARSLEEAGSLTVSLYQKYMN
ncbi:class II aldolase/adducin family protein [Bacteriovorax stolpii]|uniref:rRNA adenine methyltransferase n=1 Tax=Bacteriovorax stolpii TaxID=960 RepID=A0A2K9NVS9_BACTC|nr:class II aldolase/adducin family protein [Bacteriovorax stolpii]AUN99633.1 rRNA adenine methyltransferase [Bacteriovorax stolpii]QDK40372.1 class II aldolase/adducin family protein [Bacteriovorax stolpii]TDP51263.1 class II aldolase/adducin N-terminal domain-containing protein [Bacteriovorax stolpii]